MSCYTPSNWTRTKTSSSLSFLRELKNGAYIHP
jgi:hypothetical protein